ncbi:MAG: error-prone DNA polymerase [Sinobacteraceae bacterium]|nr:error-prone DNA polymerase [Nevskiaceae bacterium]MCP5340318.1 error-prone DNA polymerase [Nevskiaceae bacterium]
MHCLTHFSFLRGASSPAELVTRALELDYDALAITDECSVAGVVRAHAALEAARTAWREAAGISDSTGSPGSPGSTDPAGSAGFADPSSQPSQLGRFSQPDQPGRPGRPVQSGEPVLRLIIGAEFRLVCGLQLVVLAADRRGYGQLCRLITRGRRAAAKGSYRLLRTDFDELLEPGHCLLLWVPRYLPRQGLEADAAATARALRARWAGSVWIAVELLRDGTERGRLAALQTLSRDSGLPLLAAGDVHMHCRARRALQDALTAIRVGLPLSQAGTALLPNGERHLRERERLARLYPPALLAETLAVAARCRFSLVELRYEYPREIVPEGWTASGWLRELTERGARRRWPEGVPAKVRPMIEHELALIAELEYEAYFLTVHDVVGFARSRGILCQGRGSAANSVVCYCLEVTEVDPALQIVLVERFISRERNEPPDIDIDFEHERREEVIQYVYTKYGRERAALAATVITYRPRRALRDLGRAFGFDPGQLGKLAGAVQWWDSTIDPARIREAGFDPDSPVVQRLLTLTRELLGFPRHLSQHVGGFVIARGLLEELVPIENAAMTDRTVIQWDKDDLDDLKLLKVDLLGLGMLTAIRRALDLIAGWRARRTGRFVPLTMADVPAEDPAVYAMISRADTVGVFQIESRAQMAMLPRLRPGKFYDLVIEVAIVRPGPIQGDMVHPYLRRRNGEEVVSYPSKAVAGVLERTLGVPIFQEQVMQLAIVAAGFTPGEADRLRRAMAAWKRRGGLEPFERKLIEGMRERGYDEKFARQIFNKIRGFGEYGFPESHAVSFALLVYISAWLKCHEPAAFAAALLNSQPMGFYAPAQLVRDARRHGVTVLPVDVMHSGIDCSLESSGPDDVPALRLGLRLLRALSAPGAARIVAARQAAPFTDVQDLARRATLERRDLEALAAGGALAALAGNRHLAFWDVAATECELPLAPRGDLGVAAPLLPRPTEGQDIVADYRSVGLSLGRHPVALLRERLAAGGIVAAAQLESWRAGARVRVAGLVIARQRPGSARGVTFVTLEDETGHVNLVVWESLGDAQRRELLESRLMEVHGRLQREGAVIHVVAERLVNRSAWLGALQVSSRDFH